MLQDLHPHPAPAIGLVDLVIDRLQKITAKKAFNMESVRRAYFTYKC